jgi:hypothetical protein
MPILPFAGRARQKRHITGRSRSSSEGMPMPWVSTWRGSSHSLSRCTDSLRPPPSTPLTMITTWKPFLLTSSYCVLSRASRSAGNSFS